jgi:hypothetical protein
MKLRVPSPAVVISTGALIAAIGGTAYAATLITSSSQIKDGIVSSGDIQDGTIRRVDLAPGLAKLTTTGALEGTRPSGPANQPANVLAKIGSITIPAGSYIISASTTLAGIVQPSSLTGTGVVTATASCKLDAGGAAGQAQGLIAVQSRQTPSTMYMQLTRTLAASTAVDVPAPRRSRSTRRTHRSSPSVSSRRRRRRSTAPSGPERDVGQRQQRPFERPRPARSSRACGSSWSF